jgi:5-methylcytosine-specific restriction endonuclease McrA
MKLSEPVKERKLRCHWCDRTLPDDHLGPKYCDKECKERAKAQRTAWRKANSEKIKTYSAAWREANHEKAKAQSAAWYKANPEKIKARCAAWRKANPERVGVNNARRRAIKRGATIVPFTAEQLTQHLNNLGNVCVYCGASWRHADHFIPLNKGGKHSLDNLVPACVACNTSKSDNDPFEWAKANGKRIPPHLNRNPNETLRPDQSP